MVAIMRNQETLLAATSRTPGTTAVPSMTTAPYSGAEVRDLFKDWQLSAPGSSALISRCAEPLIVPFCAIKGRRCDSSRWQRTVNSAVKFKFHDLSLQPRATIDCCISAYRW